MSTSSLEENQRSILLISSHSDLLNAFERAKQKHKLVIQFDDLKDKNTIEKLLQNPTIGCVFIDCKLGTPATFQLLEIIKSNKLEAELFYVIDSEEDKVLLDEAVEYVYRTDLTSDKIKLIVSLCKKINTLKEKIVSKEAILNKQIAELDAVLESSTSPIFAIDDQYRFTGFNATFKNMFQMLFKREPHHNVSVYEYPEVTKQTPKLMDGLARALQGEHVYYESEYTTEEKTYYFEITINPVFSSNQKPRGATGFIHDITEKKHNEIELIKTRNAAILATKAKSEFLSNMSHEIRTPLNGIIGLTNLLMNKIVLSENKEFVQSIKYSADNLLYIINDILDLSKIEAGEVELEEVAFDLHDFLNKTRKSYQPLFDQKNLALKLVIENNLPNYAKGDPYRLNQILNNLINNALKFTEKGSVTILAELTPENFLRFKIKDTGIGISAEGLKNIFAPFKQANSKITQTYGGSGLGLTILKNLVELQNGNVSVESTPAIGTTFTVELPYIKASADEINEEAKNADPLKTEINETSRKTLKGLRVLLAEDNKINQFLATKLLQGWQAEVSIAQNGLDVLSLLQSQSFDVILMDLQMPEMDGYEATGIIRKEEKENGKPAIPIIALTADAFEETKKTVLHVGMNDFVTKPFKQDELLLKILNCIPQ